ncbi:hypothetical protein FOXG_21426 [Fusarium oxysporum f. sp. lycopersici 4287]|uniref:LysM domain-containing protein n=1 Tax=Fusarium oxysporum f. sp. lycopersici (strain 4287 / CBS 123668 / FGSC 9935 / NRRL 34936) TaxID=426428 RepID=A0A0J9VXZ1_FUSO4|nr:hypothetical protein FOXG_21426 [Fusarium oxysporum f. sp. lycopersici 4287]KNB15658.1 hypothetical protein FOXG_21426 [Fusarium oxysporum f. sp. lycopersici 4287]
MNLLIWFFIYPLLSLGCDANYRYAVWTPRPGDTLFSDVALALPDINMKEFEKLNPGVDRNKLRTDPASPYKLPYSPQMKIIPPAVWSGDCPKTLLLDGEQQALSHTQYVTTPTPPKIGHHRTGATTITGYSEEITAIASTELSTSTEPAGSGATDDAQDSTVNPTTGSATEPKETISSIATSEKPASTFRTVTGPTSTYRLSPTSISKREAGKPEPACYEDNSSTLQEESVRVLTDVLITHGGIFQGALIASPTPEAFTHCIDSIAIATMFQHWPSGHYALSQRYTVASI